MAEIRKEIRVVFKFANKNDVMLYEKLKEVSQPGKLLKELAFNYFFAEDEVVDNNYNKELLEVLNKLYNKKDYGNEIISALNTLSNKIDNLKVIQANPGIEEAAANEETIENVINEISLDAEVEIDDLDDIDF